MVSRPTNVTRGRRFEAAAERHLRARGCEILGRNVRHGRDEVDLVIRDGAVVAFVEVKGRSAPAGDFGSPLLAVTPAKRARIERVARWWIRTRPPAGGYRFDAVSVEGLPADEPRRWRVVHLPDAWRPGM